MAVGEPEINLNTWGLRYVRKGATSTQQLEKPTGDEGAYNPKTNPTGQSTAERTPSSRPTHGTNPDKTITSSTVGVSDTDINVPQQQGRQTDSQGDKDVKVQSATGSSRGQGKEILTSPQVHSGGKKYGVGGDEGATSTPPKMNDQSKEDKRVKEKRPDPKNTESMTTGVRSGKRGGKDTNPTQASSSTYLGGQHGDDAPTGKFGTVTTPARDEKGTRTKQPRRVEGALPKTKAELDLAIIKCKLLKAKDVTATHGYGSSSRYGSENTGSANIVEAGNKKETKSPVGSKTETLASERPDETEVTSYGEGATGTHGNDSRALKPTGEMRDVKEEGKGKDHGDKAPNTIINRSEDEIVHKAIELINEAYSEIDKKHDFIEETRPVRPAKRNDDDDETKKADDEHPDDKNTPEDIKTGKKRMRAQGYTSAADFDKYGDY